MSGARPDVEGILAEYTPLSDAPNDIHDLARYAIAVEKERDELEESDIELRLLLARSSQPGRPLIELAQRIGDRIRAERKRQGCTQAELGSWAGIDPYSISHFETGRRAPSAKNLRRLALALDCSADYLLDTVPGTSSRRLDDSSLRYTV